VLYMSACGVLWTAYLSYASATVVGQERTLQMQPIAAAAAAPKPCCQSVKPCCGPQRLLVERDGGSKRAWWHFWRW